MSLYQPHQLLGAGAPFTFRQNPIARNLDLVPEDKEITEMGPHLSSEAQFRQNKAISLLPR